MKPRRSRKLDRARIGAAAEDAAARYVQASGMLLLERNRRVGHLELDLIARDGDAIVVVEVRARGAGAWLHAFASLDLQKRRRLQRAAQLLWLREWRRLPGVRRVRFDVASVVDTAAGAYVEYVKAAFCPDGSYAHAR